MQKILYKPLTSIIIAGVSFLLLVGFDWPWDKWDGFFYPDGDTFNHVHEGPFKSKSDCLDWTRSMVRSSSDDYECGKNCKPNSFGLFTCKETVDS